MDTVPIANQELAEALASISSRRSFLARASALTLVAPGLGAAVLAGCTTGADKTGDSSKPQAASSDSARHPVNADSRLDTALAGGHTGTTGASMSAASAPPFQRFDPTLPPLTNEKAHRLHFHAREQAIRINQDTTVAAWTFEGNMPGPIVHCRVGDTIEFTLTNEVAVPHSMDFHAAQIDPKTAFRSVTKDQSVSFTFTPKYAGAFMYHCGSAPVLMHIGSGMFGAIIVSPKEDMAPAKEFVIIQNEFYLGAAVNGIRPFDYTKMLSTLPDFVVFNGRPGQYIDAPIRVKVGDRVRFWVVNAGPTHPCAFHVVGEQFDTIYLGAPPASPLRGVQTFSVPAGGGMCFELVCDVAGDFPFVNHAFGHGQKGSIGILSVEP